MNCLVTRDLFREVTIVPFLTGGLVVGKDRAKLYVKLSSTTEEETVQDLFPEAVDVYLPRDGDGERRG